MLCISNIFYSSCFEEIPDDIIPKKLKNPWDDVSSFDELKETMSLYLKGQISHTPVFNSPLDKETNLILEELLILNELGFVSTNSQPAGFCLYQGDRLITHSINPTNSLLYKDVRYTLQSQWGFVSGFLKLNDPYSFLELLNSCDIQYCLEKVSSTNYHHKYYSSDTRVSIPINRRWDPEMEGNITGLKLTTKYTFSNQSYFNKAYLDVSETRMNEMNFLEKCVDYIFHLDKYPESPILYTFKQYIDYPMSIREPHPDIVNGRSTCYYSDDLIQNRGLVEEIKLFDNDYYKPSKDDSLWYLVIADKNLGERWDRIFRILIDILCKMKDIKRPSEWKQQSLTEYTNSSGLIKQYMGNFRWEYLSTHPNVERKLVLF